MNANRIPSLHRRPAAFASLTLVALVLLAGAPAWAQKLDAPTLTCVGSGPDTIHLQICAGASGAPAGFSLQWQTPIGGCADHSWSDSDDPGLCKLSGSGVPSCSLYNLAPFACVTLDVGNLPDSECGLSLHNCGADLLECDTEYVFRAFAHNEPGKNGRKRSDFTGNVCCSTSSCDPGCTLTYGYWQTHDGSPNADAWPDLTGLCGNGGDGLDVGGQCYSKAELLALMNAAGAGNGLLITSHQYVSAKLNVLAGADGSCVADAIASFDAAVAGACGGNKIAPAGTCSASGGTTSAQRAILTAYNEGNLPCADHCDDGEVGPDA